MTTYGRVEQWYKFAAKVKEKVVEGRLTDVKRFDDSGSLASEDMDDQGALQGPPTTWRTRDYGNIQKYYLGGTLAYSKSYGTETFYPPPIVFYFNWDTPTSIEEVKQDYSDKRDNVAQKWDQNVGDPIKATYKNAEESATQARDDFVNDAKAAFDTLPEITFAGVFGDFFDRIFVNLPTLDVSAFRVDQLLKLPTLPSLPHLPSLGAADFKTDFKYSANISYSGNKYQAILGDKLAVYTDFSKLPTLEQIKAIAGDALGTFWDTVFNDPVKKSQQWIQKINDKIDVENRGRVPVDTEGFNITLDYRDDPNDPSDNISEEEKLAIKAAANR